MPYGVAQNVTPSPDQFSPNITPARERLRRSGSCAWIGLPEAWVAHRVSVRNAPDRLVAQIASDQVTAGHSIVA
jgi:hypothetical protein